MNDVLIIDEIKHAASNYKKNSLLVDQVLRMSIKDFRTFIEVLGSAQVNQLHVAKLFVQESEGDFYIHKCILTTMRRANVSFITVRVLPHDKILISRNALLLTE